MQYEWVTVNSRSYELSIRRSWNCRLVQQNGELIELEGRFENKVDHPDLGVIHKGTISYEYFWLDRWYNVFRFHEPDGAFRNFYCNICLPPVFSDGVLDYVDLAIDLLVWPDRSQVILDMDEFLADEELGRYSREARAGARRSLAELQQLIADGGFPFQEANFRDIGVPTVF